MTAIGDIGLTLYLPRLAWALKKMLRGCAFRQGPRFQSEPQKPRGLPPPRQFCLMTPISKCQRQPFTLLSLYSASLILISKDQSFISSILDGGLEPALDMAVLNLGGQLGPTPADPYRRPL